MSDVLPVITVTYSPGPHLDRFLGSLSHASERPLSVKEAAELVSLSLPAASRAVDDLVRRGFAERHEDLADRRMKRVSITDPGLAAIRQINAARLSSLEEFAHTLTAPERTKLVAALARLLQRPEVAACRLEDR